MNKLSTKLILGTVVAAVTSTSAFAGNVEYAKVVRAEPIYRQVRVSAPRQECRDERVVYREPTRSYSSGNNGAAVLLGAALGGVAGHQFGKGRGNAAATAAGALIGAGIGQSHGRSYNDGGYTERVAYEPRCTTYDDTRTEEHFEGYDVTYRYNGRTYHTTTQRDPGAHIPVNVDVSPAYDY